MVRKEFVVIATILLLVFIGITAVKLTRPSNKVTSSYHSIQHNSSQTFWIYFNRATEYRLDGKTDSSITFYKKALRLNPDHKDALYYIGNMYVKADKFNSAQKVWKKLTQLNPQSERAYNQLGNLYFCVRHKDFFNPHKSMLYFKRANNLNPRAINPNIRLGEIAVFMNRKNDALGILNNLLMTEHKNAEVYFLLGYVDWETHQSKSAADNLERTFEHSRQLHLMTDEDGGTNISAKNAAVDKIHKCDLFMNWIVLNLNRYKKYDVKVAVSKVYSSFNKYLREIRKKMAHM